MKYCNKCETTKSLDDFNNNPKLSDGKRSTCRTCERKYRIEYKESGRKAAYLRKHRASGGKTTQDYILENPKKEMFYGAKTRAKGSGLDFNITIDDIVIPDICPIFNIPLFRGKGSSSGNSPSLDRRDNSKGYVKGNICVISNRANSLKRDTTIEDLEKIIKYMKD